MNGLLLLGTLLIGAWLAIGPRANEEEKSWKRLFRIENRVFLALLLGPTLYFGRIAIGERSWPDWQHSAGVVMAMVAGSSAVALAALMVGRKQLRRRWAAVVFAAAAVLPILAGLRIHILSETSLGWLGVAGNVAITDLYIFAIVACSIWVAIFEEWPFVSLAASALCVFVAGYIKFGWHSSEGELFALSAISTCGALMGLATGSALFGGRTTRKYVIPGVAFWCACLTIILPVKRVLFTSIGATALFFGLPIAIALAEALRIWVRRNRPPVVAGGVEVQASLTYGVVSAVGLTLLNLIALFWVIAR